MPWTDALLDDLSTRGVWGYAQDDAATEPAALVALAATAHQQAELASAAANWLEGLQAADGSLGIGPTQPEPCWPTSLAVCAWAACARAARSPAAHHEAVARGVAWLLEARGETAPRNEQVAHDATLVGWPWVLGTHSWVEPTALAVLALRATGQGHHPRTLEAVRLLVDRLLPDGGCNYGNTYVLGQVLRPHVQPSGIALVALAGLDVDDSRVGRTIDYLTRSLSGDLSPVSLAWGVIGLAAHGRRPREADRWLELAASRRPAERPSNGSPRPGAWAPYTLALLALAASEASFVGTEETSWLTSA